MGNHVADVAAGETTCFVNEKSASWLQSRFVHVFWTRHPLVNCYITMENHHAIDGRTHNFYEPFSIANCDKLPEGIVLVVFE